jgi:hypothetical protein
LPKKGVLKSTRTTPRQRRGDKLLVLDSRNAGEQRACPAAAHARRRASLRVWTRSTTGHNGHRALRRPYPSIIGAGMLYRLGADVYALKNGTMGRAAGLTLETGSPRVRYTAHAHGLQPRALRARWRRRGRAHDRRREIGA